MNHFIHSLKTKIEEKFISSLHKNHDHQLHITPFLINSFFIKDILFEEEFYASMSNIIREVYNDINNNCPLYKRMINIMLSQHYRFIEHKIIKEHLSELKIISSEYFENFTQSNHHHDIILNNPDILILVQLFAVKRKELENVSLELYNEQRFLKWPYDYNDTFFQNSRNWESPHNNLAILHNNFEQYSYLGNNIRGPVVRRQKKNFNITKYDVDNVYVKVLKKKNEICRSDSYSDSKFFSSFDSEIIVRRTKEVIKNNVLFRVVNVFNDYNLKDISFENESNTYKKYIAELSCVIKKFIYPHNNSPLASSNIINSLKINEIVNDYNYNLKCKNIKAIYHFKQFLLYDNDIKSLEESYNKLRPLLPNEKKHNFKNYYYNDSSFLHFADTDISLTERASINLDLVPNFYGKRIDKIKKNNLCIQVFYTDGELKIIPSDEQYTTCRICLNHTKTFIDCGHTFCIPCIKKTNSTKCCLCQSKIYNIKNLI